MRITAIATGTLLLVAGIRAGEVRTRISIACKGTDHCLACHSVLRSCILSGTHDINKCAACEEKNLGIEPCLNGSHNSISMHEAEAFAELDDSDYLDVAKFTGFLQEVVDSTKPKVIKEYNGEELTAEENKISHALKKKIISLCLYANYHDHYQNAHRHTQADVEEVEAHIKHIIKNFLHESDFEDRVKYFLGNPALCLKRPSDWVADRSSFMDDNTPSIGVKDEEELHMLGSSGVSSISQNERADCNREQCDRFTLEGSCESNIRLLNQGLCTNCWAFAALTVFQAYRCRRGLGFAEPSIKYVTLCKGEHFPVSAMEDSCSEGGNMSLFLRTMEKVKMLPTSHALPYNPPLEMKKCPTVDRSLPNMWEGVTLQHATISNYDYFGYMKFDFLDFANANKMEELINMLKDTVIKQGAVFISMHAENTLEFDHNGKEVFVHCEKFKADHAMTLIGYGTYTKKDGTNSSYWLIRNSWGPKWGDRGNFKLDMYGPRGCNGNVLGSAYPLNITMNGNKIEAPLPSDLASTDTDTQHDVTRTNSNDSPTRPTSSISSDKEEKPEVQPPKEKTQPIPDRRDVSPVTDPRNPFVGPRARDPIRSSTSSIRDVVKPGKDDWRKELIDNRIRDRRKFLDTLLNDETDSSDIIDDRTADTSDGNSNSNSRNKFRTVHNKITPETEIDPVPSNPEVPNSDALPGAPSCDRVFSMDPNLDILCRMNCKKNMVHCYKEKNLPSCLRSFEPSTDCFYCGL